MKNIKSLLAVFTLIVGLAVSSMAQTESLQTLDGGQFSIGSQRGKVVILAIGASWLPLSRQQAEITNRLSKKYAGRNVAVYFVTTESANAKSKNHATAQQIRDFASRNKLTVPILRDSDGAATLKTYKVDQLPSFVILDKEGNLVGSAFGGLDTDQKAMDALTEKMSQVIDKLL